jgi:hypothetical protein
MNAITPVVAEALPLPAGDAEGQTEDERCADNVRDDGSEGEEVQPGDTGGSSEKGKGRRRLRLFGGSSKKKTPAPLTAPEATEGEADGAGESPPTSPTSPNGMRLSGRGGGSGKGRKGLFHRKKATTTNDSSSEAGEGLPARPASPLARRRDKKAAAKVAKAEAQEASKAAEAQRALSPMSSPPLSPAATGAAGASTSPLSTIRMMPTAAPKARTFVMGAGEMETQMPLHPHVPIAVRACIEYLSQPR